MSSGFPSIEILEQNHDFPCVFMFKAIGKAEDSFVGRVLGVFTQELGEAIEPPFSIRTTSGGRHVCVTVQPEIASAIQVLTIYQNLHQLDGVVMLM